MNARWILAFVVLCGPSLLSQAPTHGAETHTSDMGFSYSLPSDWQVIETPPTLPQVKQEQSAVAPTETDKKGIQCVQIALNARHGNLGSTIVVLQLPEACFGQPITDNDLPGFANGALQNLRQTLVLSDPVYGSYTLGTHDMQIERVTGIAIGDPQAHYTVEVTCGILKKGAVCWMAMTANNADLATFEHGKVALDGEPPVALVPASAFQQEQAPTPPSP